MLFGLFIFAKTVFDNNYPSDLVLLYNKEGSIGEMSVIRSIFVYSLKKLKNGKTETKMFCGEIGNNVSHF